MIICDKDIRPGLYINRIFFIGRADNYLIFNMPMKTRLYNFNKWWLRPIKIFDFSSKAGRGFTQADGGGSARSQF